MKTIAQRLAPGQDLKDELRSMVERHGIRAGVLLSVVGSLSRTELRMAGGQSTMIMDVQTEIVSGTGTFAAGGAMHVHISVADREGGVIGGHLMNGCKVMTTGEIVIGDLSDEWTFERKMDSTTSSLELVVSLVEDKQ
jgi:hypothetical protein